MTRQRSAAPRQEANGTWSFVVDLGPGLDAKGQWRERRQARRRGFPTKKAAQEALDGLRTDSRTTGYRPPTDQRLGDFLAEWLDTVEPSLAPSTIASYRRMIRVHVLPRIGPMRLRDLDAGTLNAIYAELLATGNRRGKQPGGLSVRTVRYLHSILRKALAAAVRWERIKRNPAALAGDAVDWKAAKTNGRKAIRAWTADELRRFLASQADTDDHSLWTFLATTGCRRGEALGLRWRDVDLGAGTVEFRQTIGDIAGKAVLRSATKTGRGRMIQLDEYAIAAIKAQRSSQSRRRLVIGPGWEDKDLVFAGLHGGLPNPSAVSKRFERRIGQQAVPRIRLHDLRHTWATLAFKAGVHPKIVQERFGHSSIAITLDIYSHAIPAQESDAAARVAGLIFESGG